MKTVNYKNVKLEVDENTLDIYQNGKRLNQNIVEGLNRIYVTYKDGTLNKWVPRYRIICLAFHPNDNYENMQVDHIDCNQLNDSPDNLRWVDRTTNNSRKEARIAKSQNAHYTNHKGEVIEAISPDGNTTYFKNGAIAAKEIGCSHVLIYNVLNPTHWSKRAKGYSLQWKKISELPQELRLDFEDEVNFKKAMYKISYSDGKDSTIATYAEAIALLDVNDAAFYYRIKQGLIGKYVKGTKLEFAESEA